jgi:hypothetical protein
MINLRRTWGSAALHPRLYSAARIRGLRTRQNMGNDKALKRTAKFKLSLRDEDSANFAQKFG